MVDLLAGVALAKGVVDVAKKVKDLTEAQSNNELRDLAVDLRAKTIDLKEVINDMRDEIQDLKQQLEFKEKLEWNGKTFYFEENGKIIYICNGCYPKGIISYMTETKQNLYGLHTVKCQCCSKEIYLG